MTRIARLLTIACLALGMAALGAPHPTYASGGNVGDCTFTTLRNDLQTGGNWYYTAGQCPSPIVFTSTITIGSSASLTAQGNDVTLDGGHTPTVTGVELFHVNSGVPFGLTGLTLAHGNSGTSSTHGGGAIYNAGTLTITSSTLSGNTDPSSSYSGGAIDNAGALAVINSTLSTNSANFEGGAIYNDPAKTLTISSSTLSGNSAGLEGGAIANDAGAILTITGSTLSGNSTPPSQVGGILNWGTMQIGGSIIAGNPGGNCFNYPGHGTSTDAGYNIEDANDCSFTATTSKPNTDPKVDTSGLQNNGGPTKTIALQSTSPAIDQIPTGTLNCTAGGTDQRGVARPDGAETRCDIGAYEYQDPSLPTPTLTTTASSAVTLDATGPPTLTDTAVLSGGNSPTGSITFTLTLGGTTVSTAIDPVSGDGSYSASYTLPAANTAAGTYTWSASYGGDGNNAGAHDQGGSAERTVVSPAGPALTTQASETAGGAVGTAMLSDTATISGGYNPTGGVTFTLTAPDGTTSPEGSVTVGGNGSYTSPTPVMAAEVGTYTWHAQYSGDANNNTAQDDGQNEGVATVKASPSIATQASVAPTNAVGTGMLSDTATLSGGFRPGGTISFSLTAPDGTTTPEGSQTVSFGNNSYPAPNSVLATEVGTYTWHAAYSGDGNNNPASDNGQNEGVTTGQATPSLTTQASETANGVVGVAALSDTATLAGGVSPTGWITFSLTAPDGTTTPEGSVTVSGNGSYSAPTTVTATAVGTYTWHATYSGDTNNYGAGDDGTNESVTTTGSPHLVIAKTGDPAPVNSTDAVHFTITVSNTGTADALDVALSDPLPDSSGLSWVIQAGDPGTISNGTLTDTIGTLAPGTSVTVHVSAVTPSGYAATLDNTATVTSTNNNPGSVSASATDTVLAPTPTSLTTTPSPGVVTLGAGHVTLTDTADLEGGNSPIGSITFTLIAPGGATVDTETVSVSGNGTYSTPTGYTLPTDTTVTGSYQWNATYTSGNSANAGSTDINDPAEQVSVSPASPTFTTAASPNLTLGTTASTITDTAVLAGGYFPTGSITFTLTLNGNPVPAATQTDPIAGNGSYSASYTLPAGGTVTGTYLWHAVYSGDANNTGAQDNGQNEQSVVNPASPAIVTQASEAPNSIVGTAMLSDTATVSGGYFPGGTISFSLTAPDGTTTPEGSVTVTGNGSYSVTTPVAATEVGTYTWHATYSGDSNNNGAADNGQNEGVSSVRATPSLTTQASKTANGLVGTAILSDSATLAGGYHVGAGSPAPTLTFTLVAPNGTSVYTETQTVTGDTTYTTTGTGTGSDIATQVGTYYWSVSYSGNAFNNAVSHSGQSDVNEQLTTIKASPSIATRANPTTAIVGGTLNDSATLSSGYHPTGTITFTLLRGVTPGTCTGTSTGYSKTVTVNGNATYTTPSAYTATATGGYAWVVTYTGDTNNTAASASGCEPVTVEYGVTLLYKPPAKASGGTVPIKLELVNAAGKNQSSSTLQLQALCVIPATAATQTCASAPSGFTYTNQFFTFVASLDTGGGYQYNLKTTGLKGTYKLLVRAANEPTTVYHQDAGTGATGATFSVS